MTSATPPVKRSNLTVLDGGRRPVMVTIPKSAVDEAQIELSVSLDERLSHTAVVRQHLRTAMRALADGRYAFAGTWLVELERINEREANRARAAQVAAKPCPDRQRLPGHGKAA